ncbi:MAG: hypothetical protein US20_C0002G0003 [Candidatus Pacebacteria bacterium GW2011_GWF1_36_5]|nr:MAG: hypothetical protein US20_C0002G0003 [Candidatus Pacebacteria bacterium GW2011_GWF1_36_5]
MKIYKVLVDELPEKCGGCLLFDTEYYMCWGTGTWDKIQDDDTRPSWCPIEVEE